jgi:4-amino-4-deoxy-L-arabinose transferase-like glycosyltransferase
LASVSATRGGANAVAATRHSLVLLQIAVAYFVGLKIVYAVMVPPNGDEAYYWLWGGHLQLSYYDHAPMVGWVAAIARLLPGWTPAALHLPALVTFLVLVCTLRRAARWVAPEDPAGFFWLGLATLCASPLFNALTTLNYPDHLLICFAAPALLLFGRYLGDVPSGSERQRDLYLGAALLGLAGLSKYSAVFVAAGLVLTIIAVPRLRRLFRSPHLYAAGALTLLLVMPVIVWNAQHRFVSIELHALDRLNDEAAGFTPLLLVRAIILCVLMLSPFLVMGFCRFLLGRPARPAGVIQIGRGTAIISTLVLLPLAGWGAFGTQVSPHWLVLSFLPFMLVAPFYLRSRWLIGLHLGWGVLINTVAVLYYVLAPLPTELLGIRDYEAARTFGQEQLAAEVTRLAEAHGATAIVDTGYSSLSRLTFALGSDTGVTDLGRRIDRLTGRTFGPVDAGTDMLLLGSPDDVEGRFERFEPLPTVEVRRFDRVIASYEIWLARGFKP